jgi:hypothetical protein
MAIFGDRINWILLWSSQVKFLKYFFSYALFLLKRCESENKEGTSSTSGKSVKKRKHRKYDSYFYSSQRS